MDPIYQKSFFNTSHRFGISKFRFINNLPNNEYHVTLFTNFCSTKVLKDSKAHNRSNDGQIQTDS